MPPEQSLNREFATDVPLYGDEVAPDADDGDAGHATRTYVALATGMKAWISPTSKRHPALAGSGCD